MPGPGFLDLPVRSAKPRRTGITHVLDRGIPLAQATDLLEQNECYVDVWKFGWGIGYLDPQLAAKRDLIAAVGPDCVVFEAPREDQQAWFVRRFGPDVNLANVPPDGALGLETFRLSLRADTYGAPAPSPVMGTVPARGT
jgi:phosphosulfolactate synthase (CoM biosynthesis protein A)